jgi:hypothetical protein
MAWPIKTSGAVTKGTEEAVVVVSKQDLALVWTGAKTIYSGICGSNDAGASGYWFESGDVDIQPINDSGWGCIRIPELSEVHKLFVFPKDPNLNARCAMMSYANVESGVGGISGNVALVHYAMNQGTSGFYTSGSMCWASGTLVVNSGLIDIIAFGSIY